MGIIIGPGFQVITLHGISCLSEGTEGPDLFSGARLEERLEQVTLSFPSNASHPKYTFLFPYPINITRQTLWEASESSAKYFTQH